MKKYKSVLCILGLLGIVGFGCLDVNCMSVGDVQVIDFSEITSSNKGLVDKNPRAFVMKKTYSKPVIIEPVKIFPKETIIKSVAVPKVEGCRSYNITFMPYTAVTDKKSKQYAFLNGGGCYTEEDTGLRKYGDRYCVAVGSGFATEIGTKLNVHMKNGEVIKCILGDSKSDSNTDETHLYHNEDGSVLEMIVDSRQFTSSKDYPIELSGSIVSIDIVK